MAKRVALLSNKAARHQGGAGNFADDREKASEAGRKGGQS
jgi:general stress protein YciG